MMIRSDGPLGLQGEEWSFGLILCSRSIIKKKVPTTVNANELLLFIINCFAPSNKVNDPEVTTG